MERHERDLTSLVAGLLFLTFGVGYALAAATNLTFPVEWALPVLLIGLGLAGLAGTRRRR